MELNKSLIIESFTEEADTRDIEWWYGRVTYLAVPTINIGFQGTFNVFKKDGTRSKAASFFSKADEHLKEYFIHSASKAIANEIELVIENKKIVEIICRWNPKVIENFENLLPKSKRGKIKPWYIVENEKLSNAGL